MLREEGSHSDMHLKNFLCRSGTCAKVSRKKWILLKDRVTEFFPSSETLIKLILRLIIRERDMK